MNITVRRFNRIYTQTEICFLAICIRVQTCCSYKRFYLNDKRKVVYNEFEFKQKITPVEYLITPIASLFFGFVRNIGRYFAGGFSE